MYQDKICENRIPRIGCVVWQNRSQLINLSNNISSGKGYFRETYKSQNINPISPTPKLTLGIIQIDVKSLSTRFQC